jgi:hypothetical protein
MFIASTEVRRKKVHEENFNKKKVGAWWRMILYLNTKNIPYGKMLKMRHSLSYMMLPRYMGKMEG